MIVKTIFGLGNIILSRVMANGTIKRIEFSYFIREDIDIILNIKNQSKKARSGKDLSYIDGCYFEFNLVLSDPIKNYGEGGQKLIDFFDLMNDYLLADEEDQYIDIIPANSSQTSTEFKCKIISNIKLRDIKDRGAGQRIEFKIRLRDKSETIPYNYYVDVGDTTNVESELQDAL